MAEMQKVVNTPAPPAGKIGKAELYALGLGQVIGVGVITLVGPMVAVTGKSTWLAYLVAVILGFVSLLPYVFLTNTLRFGSGIYSYCASTLDYRVSGMLAITFIPTTMGMASLGTSFGMYFNSLFPAVPAKVAGVAILLIFFLINLGGVNVMAKVQKYGTWLLIGGLMLFIIAGLFQIKYPAIFDVMADDFMASGSKGFTSAIATFMYSTVGYSLLMAYGGQSKNAKRDMPWAYLAVFLSLIVLYVGVAIVATSTVPLEDFAGQSLVVVARAILPTPLFIAFIICGPIMALLTTINASMVYYQLPFAQSCEDGWLPKSWNIQNKNGVCLPILIFCVVMGIIPQISGISIVAITNNLQLMTSCLAFVYFLAFYLLPTKYPEAWKKATMHLPNGVYYGIVTVALAVQLYIFYNACRNLTAKTVIISLVAMVVCMAYGFIRAKSPSVQIKTSTWEE